MFKIAEKRQKIEETPFTRWKKILPSFMPARKDTGISIVKGINSLVFLMLEENKYKKDLQIFEYFF